MVGGSVVLTRSPVAKESSSERSPNFASETHLQGSNKQPHITSSITLSIRESLFED